MRPDASTMNTLITNKITTKGTGGRLVMINVGAAVSVPTMQYIRSLPKRSDNQPVGVVVMSAATPKIDANEKADMTTPIAVPRRASAKTSPTMASTRDDTMPAKPPATARASTSSQ